MGLKEKTVKSVKWNAIATGVTMLIQIAQLAILTHLLEKSDFGIVAIASIIISFTDIFSEMGIAVALIHKQDISQEEYSSVYWLNIFVSIIICLLTILLAPVVADFYNEPILKIIIMWFSLKILFNAFGKMFYTIKIKNLDFAFISKVRIMTAIIGGAFTVFLAYKEFGVMSLVYGQLLGVGINQMIFALSGLSEHRIKFHFSFEEVRPFLNIGLFQLGTQMLDFIAGRLDVFLIGKFCSMADLGIYNIAKDLIIKPYSIINTVSSSVFSATFAKMQNTISRLIDSFRKIIRMTAIIAIIVYTSLFILSDLIVSVLYAPQFSEVATFIKILSLIGIFAAITSQAATVMIATGRTDLGFRWTIIRLVLSVLFILSTAPFGVYHIAVGQTVLEILSLFIYFFIIIKPILKDITLGQYVDTFWRELTFSICFVLIFLYTFLIFDMALISQVVGAVLFNIIFVLLLYKKEAPFCKEIIGMCLPPKH